MNEDKTIEQIDEEALEIWKDVLREEREEREEAVLSVTDRLLYEFLCETAKNRGTKY